MIQSVVFRPKLIRKITLSAVGTTFTFLGLDLATHRVYKIFLYADNDTGNNGTISIYFNNDTTATNYYRQYCGGSGAVVGTLRENNANIGALRASSPEITDITIMMSSDKYARAISLDAAGNSSTPEIWTVHVSKVAAVTNVTRIDLISDQNMKAGSTAILYAFP